MYGKHYASTYTGSMYGAGLGVFAVWGYVISHVDQTHYIELNPKQLADTLGTNEATVAAAIELLCAPDPSSRSKEENGRRLVQEGPFLYRVVNHDVYRRLQDNDARRDYFRNKKREYRDVHTVSTPVHVCPQVSTPCPQVSTPCPQVSTGVHACPRMSTDTDTDTDTEDQNISATANAVTPPKTKKRAVREKTDHPIREVLVEYDRLFCAKTGEKPDINGGKDAALVKMLLSRHGKEQVLKRLEAFFASRDQWIQGCGYTVGAFKACWNKLAAAKVAVQSTGRTGPAPRGKYDHVVVKDSEVNTPEPLEVAHDDRYPV